ncbi:hypothetical protein FRC12_007385 [Ceratobasidium sp. 428]|nr:hypothetical protein FRC12_007385 [Ceratobasidium sp. 428]
MSTNYSNQSTSTSIKAVGESKRRHKKPKTAIVSPSGDDGWFSEEYIARDGNLYKCLLCPGKSGFNPWRKYKLMRDHQKRSIIHAELVEKAKAAKKSKAGCSRLALYYPSSSPEEPIEDATPLFYNEPEELIKPHSNSQSYLDSSGATLIRTGILEPLDLHGEISYGICKFMPHLETGGNPSNLSEYGVLLG